MTNPLRETIAAAIWEATHPNPPGWVVWGDHTLAALRAALAKGDAS